MKTIDLEKVKNDVAKSKGFDTWHEFMYKTGREQISIACNEAMQEYARQMCDVQIVECSKNFLEGNRSNLDVLSTPNVVEIQQLDSCELYGHDSVPDLGFDNVVKGDICRICSKKF